MARASEFGGESDRADGDPVGSGDVFSSNDNHDNGHGNSGYSLPQLRLWVHSHRRTLLLSTLLLTLLTLLFLYLGHSVLTALLVLLQGSAEHIRALGRVGAFAVLAGLVFVTCAPVMLGYGVALYYCGYVWGFPWGWFPAFTVSAETYLD